MNINLDVVKDTWFTYPDGDEVEFQIRPWATSAGYAGYDDEVMAVRTGWLTFNYCLMNWKGMNDKEGKLHPCNEEVKKFIFDRFPDMAMFVVQKAQALTEEVNKQIKN